MKELLRNSLGVVPLFLPAALAQAHHESISAVTGVGAMLAITILTVVGRLLMQHTRR